MAFAPEEVIKNLKFSMKFNQILHERAQNLGISIPELRRLMQVDPTEINIEYFICPKSKCFLHDPVIAEDGYTYDRKYIEAWFKANDRSPMTNAPIIQDKRVIPNLALKSMITSYTSGQKVNVNEIRCTISEKMFLFPYVATDGHTYALDSYVKFPESLEAFASNLIMERIIQDIHRKEKLPKQPAMVASASSSSSHSSVAAPKNHQGALDSKLEAEPKDIKKNSEYLYVPPKAQYEEALFDEQPDLPQHQQGQVAEEDIPPEFLLEHQAAVRRNQAEAESLGLAARLAEEEQQAAEQRRVQQEQRRELRLAQQNAVPVVNHVDEDYAFALRLEEEERQAAEQRRVEQEQRRAPQLQQEAARQEALRQEAEAARVEAARQLAIQQQAAENAAAQLRAQQSQQQQAAAALQQQAAAAQAAIQASIRDCI